MNKYIKSIGLCVATAIIALGAASCSNEPEQFELKHGKPVIKYVRTTDPEKSDSLLTSAYMDNLICIVGDNLRSIREMYFNDQKAILNTSLITQNTLLVVVPGNIPEEVTNKIYMTTYDGDVVTYDFGVLVPGPQVRSMDCEFVKPGNVATLIGDYFIDDPNVPLTISMAGNVPVTEILSIEKTRVKFVVPEGSLPGYVNVSTIYGNGRSSFQYMDTRNVLFDWDGKYRDAMAMGNGWRDGSKVLRAPGDDPWEAIDGNYICFSGELAGDAGATWAEDGFSFNYWPDPDNGKPELSSLPAFADMLAEYELSQLQVKFEVYVPSSNPWSSSALQVIFSGNDQVTAATATNGYFSDASLPRGLWLPWQMTGSYDTGDQWLTVSLPMSNFNYTFDGGSAGSAIDKSQLTGLTFFVWNGGINGTDCAPIICIDNIRVVPIE